MSTIKINTLDSQAGGAIAVNQNLQFAAGKGPDSGSTYLPLLVGGSEYGRLTNGGDLALGLTAPGLRLHVREETDYQFRADFNASNYADYGYQAINVVGNDFELRQDGNDYLTLDSSTRFFGFGNGNNSPKGLIDLLAANIEDGLRGGNVLTDTTRKFLAFMTNHYTNAEQPLMVIYGDSQAAKSEVNIGGGASSANAATEINLYTAGSVATVTGTLRVKVDDNGNFGVNTGTFGASAAGVLAIANGTQGDALANAIQLISEDLSAGHTIPSIRTEGTDIYSAGTPAAASGSIAIKINGTVYYFTVSTSAAS